MHRTSPGDNRRILIIDDYPSIHDDIKKMLGSTGASELEDVSAALCGGSAELSARFDDDIDSAYQGQVTEGGSQLSTGSAPAVSAKPRR